ncbi:methylenetetrahydrofolate reductase [Alphaproteobacteria bacterium]|nr:methylenetetrahydrofolate reductase [Alphaproteobacteria bacterium]
MAENKKPKISFEFFPPKSLNASFTLWETLHMLLPFQPEFVSITYGANGSTRDLTRDVTKTIAQKWNVDVAAHLTCVDATRLQVMDVAKGYLEAGIKQIVALRGDAPKGESRFTPMPDGFADSVALVSALAKCDFDKIWVGAYPEPHPDATYNGADIDWLKRKIDAGATGAITQFFFDPEMFLRFRDRAAKAGIKAPIVPGVLPIENWEKAKFFAARCGATIPDSLAHEFAMAKRNKVEDILSVVVATDICADLMDEGVDQFHFYTLNKPFITRNVCTALGILPINNNLIHADFRPVTPSNAARKSA